MGRRGRSRPCRRRARRAGRHSLPAATRGGWRAVLGSRRSNRASRDSEQAFFGVFCVFCVVCFCFVVGVVFFFFFFAWPASCISLPSKRREKALMLYNDSCIITSHVGRLLHGAFCLDNGHEANGVHGAGCFFLGLLNEFLDLLTIGEAI